MQFCINKKRQGAGRVGRYSLREILPTQTTQNTQEDGVSAGDHRGYPGCAVERRNRRRNKKQPVFLPLLPLKGEEREEVRTGVFLEI
ncbi:MAG TPA: hypothetical protein VMJ64_06395 [Anaerolineales bacterium]|nr:hypothetical protein [Anaerolineales bacterium]